MTLQTLSCHTPRQTSPLLLVFLPDISRGAHITPQGMATRLVRVFSSAANLEEQDEPFILPQAVTERRHVLGAGCDYFDEKERPVQPPPQRLHKAFSGSQLDLDEAAQPLPTAAADAAAAGASSTSSGTFDGAGGAAGGSGVIAVVGGSLYLNGHIVSALLERGFAVHALVHDLRANNPIAAELYALAAAADAGAATNGAARAGATGAAAAAAVGGSSGDLSTAVTPSAGDSTLMSPAGPLTRRRLVVDDVDMFDGASLRDALKRSGCRGVIHGGVNVAADVPGPRVIDLHSAAVRALFEAVRGQRPGAIERVVVTSATAAVAHASDDCPASGFDESHTNTKSTAAEEPAAFAKALFELELWRLLRATGVNLTVIVPSLMLGPSRTTESSEMTRLVRDFARGSSLFPFAPAMWWNLVDVRDVAIAHVLALEVPEARNRRYVVSAGLHDLPGLGRMIRAANARLKAPIYTMPTVVAMLGPLMPGSRARFSYMWRHLGLRRPLNNARAVAELGLAFRPMADTVRDSVKELTDQGMLPEATGAVDADAEATRVAAVVTVVAAAAIACAVWYLRRPRAVAGQPR